MGAYLSRLDLTWDDLLMIRLDKQVEVKVWRVGLLMRITQLLIIVYVFYSLYQGDQWAYREVPTGTINAWPGGGSWSTHATTPNFNTDLNYCGNSDFSFVYGPNFRYDNPVCDVLPPYSITRKAPNMISITTVFIETHEVGWACADSVADVAERAACTARTGTVASDSSQCKCSTTRTVFPVGTDLMTISFSHVVTATTADSSFAELASSSNTAEGAEGALPTYVENALNGSKTYIPSGSSISMSLQEWMAIAGASLDEPHMELAPDYDDPSEDTPVHSRHSRPSL